MGFRITTNMMMSTYRYNLMQNTGQLDSSRNKVFTQRKFSSYAEDPAAATHAWRLRRSLTQNAGFQTSNSEAYTRINTAYITLKSINNNLVNGKDNQGGVKDAIERAESDPSGGARTALGKVLKDLAESVVFSMNGAKYGDHFVFSGNDEMNAPFTWDGKKLLYRGVNVNAGEVKSPATPPDWGKLIPVKTPEEGKGADELEEAWIDYYRNNGLSPAHHVPDWVEDYKQYKADMIEFNSKPAGPDNPSPPKEPALPEEMTALDEAWMAYLDTEADPAKLDPTKAPDQQPEPQWGDAELPSKIPEIDRTSSPWERAWAAYYTNMTADPPDPNVVCPKDVDPTQYDWYNEWKDNGTDLPPLDKTDDQGNLLYTDDVERAWLSYCHDQRDLKKLEAMMSETKVMDLGMGFQEDTGERDLIQTTAFNRALPGIAMLGYGVDADGDPQNLVSIMMRLSEIYANCDEESGDFATDEEREESYRLLDKFNQAHDRFNSAYTDVDTKGAFLQSNGTRLKDQEYNLKEQIADVEQVDLADALQDFSWAYYCYSSALKIGTQLLSQSLIDYMR